MNPCAGDIYCTSWDVTSSSSSHWLLSLHTCPLSSLSQRPSEPQRRRTTPWDTEGKIRRPWGIARNYHLINYYADNLATMDIHKKMCCFQNVVRNIMTVRRSKRVTSANYHHPISIIWMNELTTSYFLVIIYLFHTRASRKGRICWPGSQQEHLASRRICQMSYCRRVHLWWQIKDEA